ncbi:peptidoglycan-binding protein [Limibaculum sp. M0105]|uniref:Peptidoglycan-binding protein n=1 Tax=Thermohalobaculum xanthum TaxID=2753746 RepID=A0A8J7SGX6_9RHOB|nr:peptidoglycan-binding protein [Thermohalobaculum xanthum]MBK0401266.1 peptidoglycan-binding protein [Thermohalobaculum xanthum]
MRAMRNILKNAAIALVLVGLPLAACAPGMRGEVPSGTSQHAMPVADAQSGLARLGFKPGPVDGIYGPRTRNAVMDYQRMRGLQVTGQIDQDFARSLDAEIAALPRRPAPKTTDVARAPAKGDLPQTDTNATGTIPGETTSDPLAPPPAVPQVPDTTYRQSDHDPSLVALTETRSEQLADVRFAEVDLDGDGDLDVIWNNTSSLYCGTAGCSFDIYFREGTGWRPVARLLAFEVDVAAGRTRGVRDILVTGRRGSALWQWNGRHYAPAA